MPLRIVLDTNILLVSVSRKSPYYGLYRALIEERYELLVSTAISLEYEEIIWREMGKAVADDVLGVLIEAVNVRWVEPRFHGRLIPADPDDDKFVDCALAGGDDAIVTYDRHFDILKNLAYPHVAVLTPEAFQERLAREAGSPRAD